MILIKPKLSVSELNALRERLDRRGGMNEAAELTGLSRGTIHKVMISGVCSENTARIIRRKLLKNAVV